MRIGEVKQAKTHIREQEKVAQSYLNKATSLELLKRKLIAKWTHQTRGLRILPSRNHYFERPTARQLIQRSQNHLVKY